MERLKCLNLEPVTFVGTYAASLPLGNAESSRPAVLDLLSMFHSCLPAHDADRRLSTIYKIVLQLCVPI